MNKRELVIANLEVRYRKLGEVLKNKSSDMFSIYTQVEHDQLGEILDEIKKNDFSNLKG